MAAKPIDDIERKLAKLPKPQAAYLRHQLEWTRTARVSQMPPSHDEQEAWLARVNEGCDTDALVAACMDPKVPWTEFGVQAGRGAGKTRLGAEWLARDAWEDPQALPRSVIAPTQNDVRLTCFEGESGLMNIIPPECVANYNRSELILTLANDAIIRGFSAEKPDRLRGPQSASGWGDEIAAWGVDGEETLDMFMFGLRLGPLPRFLWTSTPRPIPIVRKLTTPKPGRIIVRGSTYDNKDNLAKAFLDRLSEYDGTRMGRQEIYGELIDPEEAGIIRRSWFRLWPHDKPLPRFEWIIMSLDTAFTERTLDKKGDPDPTACGVWGVFRHEKRSNVMLLDCWEDFLGLPDLARRVKREMNTAYGDDEDAPMIRPLFGSSRQHGAGRKPDILLIEDKGSGISLRQTLAEQGIEAYAYNPGRADKLARLHIVSPIFAQKRVWLPESEKKPGAPKNWAEPLVEQLCSFAGTGSLKHDDHIDATTQCIRLCMDKRLLEVSPPSREEREARQFNEAKRLSRGPAVNPYAQ